MAEANSNSGATQGAKIGCGGLLGAFGLLMVAGGLIQIFEGNIEHSLGENITLTLILGVVPVAIAAWMVVSGVKTKQRIRDESNERAVFTLAEQSGWTLTPVDVARSTPMSLGEATAFLDKLAREGHVELDIERGVARYVFPHAKQLEEPVLDPLEERFRQELGVVEEEGA